MGDFSMQLEGVEELHKRLRTAINKTLQEDVKDTIRKGALDIKDEAILRAPGDLGFLKNSIFADPVSDENQSYEAGVEVRAKYGPYVEFGTGTKVTVPPDLTDYAIQFKGTHIVPGMKAQPYFFPAAKRQKPLIENRIKTLVEKV